MVAVKTVEVSARHDTCAHDCEAVSQGPFRVDYLFQEPKAFPKILDALRWSFFQRVGGR